MRYAPIIVLAAPLWAQAPAQKADFFSNDIKNKPPRLRAARHVHSVAIAISESKRKVLLASDSTKPLPGVQPVQ